MISRVKLHESFNCLVNVRAGSASLLIERSRPDGSVATNGRDCIVNIANVHERVIVELSSSHVCI